MDKQYIDIELLDQSREILQKLFDVVRVIDPHNWKVIDPGSPDTCEQDAICSHLLNRESQCENCVSMRALRLNDTVFKLERSRNKILLIAAVPMQSGRGNMVLELIKDVTGSMIVENMQAFNKNQLLKLLDSSNQLQVKDSLTGLYNRRYIDERLPLDMAESASTGRPLSIIIADIDHFKRINDLFGHVAGDHILKGFSSILQDYVNKQGGWAGRYGGDEFLINLKNTSRVSAEVAAESMRSLVEKSIIVYNNCNIRITSSFGASTINTIDKTTPQAFIENADKNLYKAKSSGRNRVVSGEFLP